MRKIVAFARRRPLIVAGVLVIAGYFYWRYRQDQADAAALDETAPEDGTVSDYGPSDLYSSDYGTQYIPSDSYSYGSPFAGGGDYGSTTGLPTFGCPPGYTLDAASGSCIPSGVGPDYGCPKGYKFDSKSNRCIPNVVGGPVKIKCGRGRVYDAAKQKCVPDERRGRGEPRGGRRSTQERRRDRRQRQRKRERRQARRDDSNVIPIGDREGRLGGVAPRHPARNLRRANG